MWSKSHKQECQLPKVSVVIPSYNHAAYLKQRIESVLSQGFQDFELIILDDASTDNSREILGGYSDHPRVRGVYYNSVNSGSVFAQWNSGVARAKGEYIWIAESDDYSDPRFLGTLVDVLDSDAAIGVAYTQSWRVDARNNKLSDLSDWTSDLDSERWRSDYTNDGNDECRRYMVLKCTIPNASGVVFRRSVYEEAGGADEGYRLAGDWMLWTKLLILSNIAFVAEPLNYFRIHDQTVRASSARSSIILHETSQIVSFILRQVDVPDEIREAAFNRLLDRWILELSIHGIRPSEDWCFYRIFQSLDSGIHRRVRDRILGKLSRRLGAKSA